MNSDAVQRETFREKFLQGLDEKPWTKKEGLLLKDIIHKQLMEESFKRLYSERSQNLQAALHEKAKEFSRGVMLQKELQVELSRMSLPELWEMQGCKADWHTIAQKFHSACCGKRDARRINPHIKAHQGASRCTTLTSNSLNRLAAKCFRHFFHVLDPRLTRTEFSVEEDKALIDFASDNNGYNWDKIVELLPGRTPWRCFTRYQQVLNTKLCSPEHWTPEEDQRLLLLVCQQGGGLCPTSIAAQGAFCRTVAAIQHHWDSLDPHLTRDRWDAEETRRLKAAVQVYGRGEWKKIQRHFPERTANSITSHFENKADPKLMCRRGAEGGSLRYIRRLSWTREEDEVLCKALEDHGAGNWSAIREELPGRSRNEVLARFQKLNPNNMADTYDILLATRQRMLPRCAVNRKRIPRKYIGFDDKRVRKYIGLNDKRVQTQLTASDFKLRPIALPLFDSDTGCAPNLITAYDEKHQKSGRRRTKGVAAVVEKGSLADHKSLLRLRKRLNQASIAQQSTPMSPDAGGEVPELWQKQLAQLRAEFN